MTSNSMSKIIDELCDSSFEYIFNVNILNNDETYYVLKYYKKLVNKLYEAFNIKVQTNPVFSQRDYYDILMLLFPFVDNWRELKKVNRLRDLFTTTKYNRYYLNAKQYNIDNYSFEQIIRYRYKVITKTLNDYKNSFYQNWSTIFPKAFNKHYKQIIEVARRGRYDFTDYDIQILESIYYHYEPDDKSSIEESFHQLNRFTPFVDIYYDTSKNAYVKKEYNRSTIKQLHNHIKDDIVKILSNKQPNNLIDVLTLIIVYQYVSGILSEVILEDYKKPNLNNAIVKQNIDKCYHYLTNKTYAEMIQHNKAIIEQNKKELINDKSKYEKFVDNVKKQDFQFGSYRTIYGLSWIAQLKFFINYTNSNVMFITGGTGVGKSTQIPKLINYASVAIDNLPNGRTICTQPRIQPTVDTMNFISHQMGVVLPNKGCDNNVQYSTSKDKDKSNNNIFSPIFRMVTDKSLLNKLLQYGNMIYDERVIKNYVIEDCKRHNIDTNNLNVSQMILKLNNDKNNHIDYITKYKLYHNIVVDEVHEHNINIDLILSIANKYLIDYKIKLFIITATFDADEEHFRHFFNFTNTNFIDNRCHFSEPFKTTTHKIEETFTNEIDTVEKLVNLKDEKKNEQILKYINNLSTYGDVIVFKSGSGEVMKCVEYLNHNFINDDVVALPFYSQLNKELLDYVKSGKHTNKISKNYLNDDNFIFEKMEKIADAKYYSHYVLVATNIAEASITIESLTHVIDDGLQKKAIFSYDTFTNDNLELFPIGETNRLQRKGRAGRTGDGFAHFLYGPGILKDVKPIYAITTDDIRPFIFSCLKHESKDENTIVIPVNTLIDNEQKFYLMHPLSNLKNDITKSMIDIINTYVDYGLIRNTKDNELFVKTEFGVFVNSLLTMFEELTLNDVMMIISSYSLDCVDSMISLVSLLKNQNPQMIFNIIHKFGSSKDKSDFMICKKYLDNVEKILFNGKMSNVLFDELDKINEHNKFDDFNTEVNLFKAKYSDLREFINSQTHNTLLDLTFFADEVGGKISIKNELIDFVANYFQMKADIIISLLLSVKTIDTKHYISNKSINKFFMTKYDITKMTIKNNEIMKRQSEYDRISYLLLYYSYQNIYIHIENTNTTQFINPTYVNIASQTNIAENVKYTTVYDAYNPKWGHYSDFVRINSSVQQTPLFIFIPGVMQRIRRLNDIHSNINYNAFSFAHTINNYLMRFLPNSCNAYKKWKPSKIKKYVEEIFDEIRV